ncbi:MAG: lipid IV(A) 3-deoxy-D-manno-octulosonic acid transferase [Gammaproteobacteria bacterium]|nr:lipid IV(A) 3-deoxy-D-manno-octulosonic acid transferase [Gammaproteobacteria bacterium]
MRYIYTFLFYLALPFVLLRMLWRSRHLADYRRRWAERFGYCPHALPQCIWIHAASVGETIAAIPLIKALQKQYPALPILITNMTITGGVRTKATFGDSVLQAYVPYDLPAANHRFLQRVNPVIALIIETELWPNMFYACRQRNIPIMVANARLSQKSANGYARVATITRQMLSAVRTLAVQTEIEAKRFVALGMPENRVVITGSIKFDVEVPADFSEKSVMLRAELGRDRLIWIAASTHATEEEIILAAHRKILEAFPDALLILVPRHPERFNQVFALSEQQGFATVRRSEGKTVTAQTTVYLSDTMGELMLMYSVSDVAFVAGSFAPIGGHNMLEAAVLGKPIITGPVLFNFEEISKKLIVAKGMLTVSNADELAIQVTKCFADKTYRQEVGENAKQFVDANRGALAKHLALINTILS